MIINRIDWRIFFNNSIDELESESESEDIDDSLSEMEEDDDS